MKKSICPYCDQAISGRYCRGCRRIVWKPVVREVDYYLNERHPDTESSCQYHGDLHTGEMGEASNRANARRPSGTSGSKGVSEWSKMAKAAGQALGRMGSERDRGNGRMTGTRQKFMGLIAVLLIYLVFSAVSMGARAVKDVRRQVMELVPEPQPETALAPAPLDIGAWEEPADSQEPGVIYDYSEEEIAAAGIPCNGSGHLPVTSDEFLSLLDMCLSEDFEFSVSSYSINQSLDQTTWYDTEYLYEVYADGEACGYIGLSFDTADRSFHSLTMSFDTADSMSRAAHAVLSVFRDTGFLTAAAAQLNFPEETDGGSEGETWETELFEGLDVFCSRSDGGGYIADMYAQ